MLSLIQSVKKNLVTRVKRNLEDTEAEILNDEGKPEQREAPRVKLQQNPAYR